VITVSTDPPEVADHLDFPTLWVTGGPYENDLRALAAEAAANRAKAITLEAHPDLPGLADAASAAGWMLTRDQLQLRCGLPILASHQRPEGFTVRPFDAGRDTTRWLEINRRAFAWHPEQGQWDAADLREHRAQPWFDPAGFLVHDGPDGEIDAFCWTKVHPATHDEPEMGEIFVIGVNPDRHGEGLGRAMVLAGLEHMTATGVATGMLYVESDNQPAVALYLSLGFTEHERHRWYRRQLQT
jgi:mycothiol synthase